MVMDAHLAALALEHGARIATTDRDFTRFPGIESLNPIAGAASTARTGEPALRLRRGLVRRAGLRLLRDEVEEREEVPDHLGVPEMNSEWSPPGISM